MPITTVTMNPKSSLQFDFKKWNFQAPNVYIFIYMLKEWNLKKDNICGTEILISDNGTDLTLN